MKESNDDPRDAHLLAALRHAPDRDATPPREVSERILAAARAAVPSARAAHAVRTLWWQRLSAWLTQPQVAASFGTLVVASLVGLLWSTREPPVVEFTPQPASAERVEAPRTPARTPPPAITPQADAFKNEGSVAAAPSTVVTEARPQPAPAPRPKQAAAKEALSRRDSGPEARQRAAAEAPAETAAVSSSAAPPAVVTAPVPQAADAAMPKAAAERQSASASDSRLFELRREAAPKPASGAASGATFGRALAAQANAAVDPLARWDAVLGIDASDSVVWRRGDRSTVPPIAHGTAQMQWWAALRRATAGTWKAQARAPQRAWLAFDVSGSAAGSIDLAGEAVIFCPAAAATCWRAPITSAQREAWTAEVARW